MTLEQITNKVNMLVGRRESVKDSLSLNMSKFNELEQRKTFIDEATAVVQEVARNTQNKLVQRFQDIVQSALDCVFPNTYTFKFEFVAKRGKTEVDMWLDKDGTRLDPLDSNGGGVVDVLCFALRIVCLTLSTTERVLILDEPFPRIRGEARKRLGDVVGGLSEKLGIQIMMVSDVAGTNITADKVYNVSMEKRHSVVTEVGNETSV